MDKDAGSLREELFRVIQHYSELSAKAKHGPIDPRSQIARILKSRFPYLLVVLQELLPLLEKDQMTYFEVLYNLIREAQQFSDVETLRDSLEEMEKLESESRIFVYAIKWLEAKNHVRPSRDDLETIQKVLRDLNRKYRERYEPEADETTTLLPFVILQEKPEPEEVTIARMTGVVRRALHELHHLMVEREPNRRKFILFGKKKRDEVEDDIMRLAWFLFRCGFTVDRIATGYYKDLTADLLNRKITEYLIANIKKISSLIGVSSHLFLITLMDFGNIYEIPQDYVDIDDEKEAYARAKTIRSKNRRGGDLLEKLTELNALYATMTQGRLIQKFLQYRYYSAYGDYHGPHVYREPRTDEAVRVYKPAVDRDTRNRQAEEDIRESSQSFSSKTRDEMAEIIKLLMDSLESPDKVKGKHVKILGDISAGAMGKVSIGIYKNEIVALKMVKTDAPAVVGNPAELLLYEAEMNRRVQSPENHPNIVEYYGLVEQDEQKILINGYYPSDSLTLLVEKNWSEKYKPPFGTASKISLATLEVITNQLLDCLRRFRVCGIVHRDLKTDNVLYTVDENGNVNQVKIIDFGVALSTGEDAVDDLFAGKVVGTFSYMAPEQARGKASFESDLYSVGAILTVLLTGRLPMIFTRTKTRQELVRQILRIEKEPRPKLVDLNPWLKRYPVLENIAATVERMLELDRTKRATADEVQEQFDGVFQHLGEEKNDLHVFYEKTTGQER
jgi:hypothetical protein